MQFFKCVVVNTFMKFFSAFASGWMPQDPFDDTSISVYVIQAVYDDIVLLITVPDSKVTGATMGPIWGW